MINSRLKAEPSTQPVPPASAPTLAGTVRYWRIVAVAVAACVAATAAYVSVMPPQWEASAHILVAPVPADADLSELGVISGSVEPARSLQTAVALLDTPAVAAATAAKLGAPWSAESVDRGVVLEPLGQSYVVQVKAQADSPSGAALLATTFMETALETRNSEIKKRAATLLALRTKPPAGTTRKAGAVTGERLELIIRTGDPSLSMDQPASPPSSPVGLPAPYKIALSAVLGLCLGVAAAWVRAHGTRPDDERRAPAYAPRDDGSDR
ncbi:Wzz/FepE/Etk N-terminal domain-containing protein [Actinoplanes sp. CA-252034]|uniref:Wzz/FepE/Etk N-terminal domain-containing protein n=1 Tax=Actinoplanes sp. CA-252034 TaxID=3239906 RepID=UPI003D95C455